MAKTQAAAATTTVGGKSYTRSNVTVPALKLEEGKPTVMRITSVIRTGKVLKERKSEDGTVMKPAKVVDATLIRDDGSDGMSGVLVCGKSIEESLKDKERFPNDSYVGKVFEVTTGAKKELGGGRTFRPVSIVELVPA